jgi:ATP-dependent Clp protease ATP-binding subunit ClpC
VFEEFTTRARRVIVMAQDEARVLVHNYVGTEHVLLALTRQDEGGAVEALAALGIGVMAVRQAVMKIVANPHAPGDGRRPPSGYIPFAPEAKEVLTLAQREVAELGHDHIGTGHLLLGLVRERDGIAAQVLVQFGADTDRVRQQVTRLHHDQGSERGPQGPAT